jgi:hypothetical protein
MTIKLTDLVGRGKKVRFVRYKDGIFIYTTDSGFEFPVPISDLGTSEVLAEDEAILFLKYIKLQLQIQTESDLGFK